MKTVREILRDADPLRHEPERFAGERDRLRQVIVAASGDTIPSSTWFRAPIAFLAAIALIVVIAAIGSQIWSHGAATLQAAIRFEVRLAEDHPAAGLREAQIAGSDRVVYLHQEIVVTNDDIEQCSLVEGDEPSRFGVVVEFNGAGTQKMQQATASHEGRPVAILIDGDVVSAPVVRGSIDTTAVISGDYTKAEADRIVNGIGTR